MIIFPLRSFFVVHHRYFTSEVRGRRENFIYDFCQQIYVFCPFSFVGREGRERNERQQNEDDNGGMRKWKIFKTNYLLSLNSTAVESLELLLCQHYFYVYPQKPCCFHSFAILIRCREDIKFVNDHKMKIIFSSDQSFIAWISTSSSFLLIFTHSLSLSFLMPILLILKSYNNILYNGSPVDFYSNIGIVCSFHRVRRYERRKRNLFSLIINRWRFRCCFWCLLTCSSHSRTVKWSSSGWSSEEKKISRWWRELARLKCVLILFSYSLSLILRRKWFAEKKGK